MVSFLKSCVFSCFARLGRSSCPVTINRRKVEPKPERRRAYCEQSRGNCRYCVLVDVLLSVPSQALTGAAQRFVLRVSGVAQRRELRELLFMLCCVHSQACINFIVVKFKNAILFLFFYATRRDYHNGW